MIGQGKVLLVAAEVWIRNPTFCMRECAELGVGSLIYDAAYLRKRGMNAIDNPGDFVSKFFAPGFPWRLIVVGDVTAFEVRAGGNRDYPSAVYPVWLWGQQPAVLMDLIKNPIAERRFWAGNYGWADNQPVEGQEHRIIISNLPNSHMLESRPFYAWLHELQMTHPQVLLHIHGSYNYGLLFAQQWRSVDIDPYLHARKGHVVLANGKKVYPEDLARWQKWVNLIGYSVPEMSVARNRCMFNIKSAKWAARHWNENLAFRSEGRPYDLESPPKVRRESNFSSATVDGDKFLCDVCSLQTKCKYFRAGGVCSIPDTEPAQLAAFFKSRDADAILDGLGTLLASQTRRLERGMGEELQEQKGLNPEVTKLADSIFNNAVKLAKLRDPTLVKPQTQVNIGIGQQTAKPLPNAVMSEIVAELENRGISRDQITPDMLMNVLNHPNAIEAVAHE